jgi:copper chaperone
MSTTTSYAVNGMSCGHCIGSVSTEINKIDGVTNVEVDLATDGPADVKVTSGDGVAVADIREAIDEAGYELAGAGQ